MHILHISDVHLTEGGPISLESAFTSVQSALDRAHSGKFAFVVVSGDLSQSASDTEYTALRAFATKTLCGLLEVDDPWRIVFVPGNHDVDWADETIFERRVIADVLKKQGSEFKKLLDQAFYQPSSSHRARVDQFGHLDLRTIQENQYSKRFTEVQKFLSSFYGAPPVGNRLFDLTSMTRGQDWSAHLFSKEKVAFYGFNSCFRNDMLSRGAQIDHESIRAAQQHRRTNAVDYLSIAVWHHGLSSAERGIDHLTSVDVGELLNAGFVIGMHGHTHQAESHDMRRLLAEHSFPVVAAGSLCAGAKERPGAIGNQFNLLEVYGRQLRVTPFSATDSNRQYAKQPSQSWSWGDSDLSGKSTLHAREHLRSTVLDSNGIARVTVTLTAVEGEGPLVLAVLTPPYCAVVHDEVAIGDGRERFPVDRQPLGDGRLRFTVKLKGKRLETLAWAYTVSNAFALTREEKVVLGIASDDYWQPGLSHTTQARPYLVRVPSDRLVLELEFTGPINPSEPAPFSQRRSSPQDDIPLDWERAGEEEARLEHDPAAPESKRWRFAISGPRLGHRYAIAHTLPDQSVRPPEALEWASTTFQQCKLDEYLPSEYRLALDIAFERATGRQLGELSEIKWLLYFWDTDTKRLQPALGNVQRRGGPFRVGNGVLGHAVRTGAPCGWAPPAGGITPSGLPVFEHRESAGTAPYKWILAFPLCINGAAIGGVTAWAQENQTRTSRQIAQYVRENDPNLATYNTNINAAFWSASNTLQNKVARLENWGFHAQVVREWVTPSAPPVSVAPSAAP